MICQTLTSETPATAQLPLSSHTRIQRRVEDATSDAESHGESRDVCEYGGGRGSHRSG